MANNTAPAPSPTAGRQRLNLLAPNLIDGILDLLTQLAIGYAPVYENPTDVQERGGPKLNTLAIGLGKQPMPPVILYRPIGKLDLDRISLQLNTQFRLLSKVLPDLKAIELNDAMRDTDPVSLPVDAMQRLRGLFAVEMAKQHSGAATATSIDADATPRLQ